MIQKTHVIAEIGINHEGNLDVCKWMMDAAKQSGADAVKLQTVDVDKSYARGSESYDLFAGSAFTQKQTEDAFQHAKQLGFDVFTTCADVGTAEWVEKLEPSAWKISSGLINHIPLIKSLAKFNRPMIVSTGLGSNEQITRALNSIKKINSKKLTLLHCTSMYPVPANLLNLSRIRRLRDEHLVDVGFSDHSLGIEAAIASIYAGANMVEKHFTLDSQRPGYDHHLSLEPDAFRNMVAGIRDAETVSGNGESQIEHLAMQRNQLLRTIVATVDLKAGEVLGENSIGIMRPAKDDIGAEPYQVDEMLGRKIKRDIKLGSAIKFDDLI